MSKPIQVGNRVKISTGMGGPSIVTYTVVRLYMEAGRRMAELRPPQGNRTRPITVISLIHAEETST